MSDKVQPLYDWLKTQPPGPVVESDDSELSFLLADAWQEFSGGDASGTDRSKVMGRVDKPVWRDPILTFDNERHGAFCQGSSRATINRWAVDIANRRATLVGQGHRQMTPRSPRFDERPVAKAIAEAILAGTEDNRVQWRKDRQSVRILTSEAVWTGMQACKKTRADRSRRLLREIASLLDGHDWLPARGGRFARGGSAKLNTAGNE
jgi:hypothetical protein